jgi:hypothetical protein
MKTFLLSIGSVWRYPFAIEILWLAILICSATNSTQSARERRTSFARSAQLGPATRAWWIGRCQMRPALIRLTGLGYWRMVVRKDRSLERNRQKERKTNHGFKIENE